MLKEIQFVLNDQLLTTSEPAGMLVLDFLRRQHKLTGTKEGCKEGDCGACMVLIGELTEDDIKYRAVTSCFVPLAELHGKHLVTIEGLNSTQLSPVQHAVIEHGGSQCGFCTPGIIVSLTGYLMQQGSVLDKNGVKYALGGNLCRCTGYASLKRAAIWLNSQLPIETGKQKRMEWLSEKGFLPKYFMEIQQKLKKIPAPEIEKVHKTDFFIAGGTDIYVQKGELIPDRPVRILNLEPGLKTIQRKGSELHIGALVTFEDFANDRQVNDLVPGIKKYNMYNASWQIRSRATLGGNIINASPIGDMTVLLLALNSILVFNGKDERHVPLKSFYKGYKQMDRHTDEILTKLIIPLPAVQYKTNFEKVSKRKNLDIASVNSAMSITEMDNKIEQVELSMGGVAPVPLYMQATCNYLKGQPINSATVREASRIALSEISPISDIRGSADYKRLLVSQFMFLHFNSLYPQKISARDYYET